MPELPEVETIRLGLTKYIVGHKIEDVTVNIPKLFQGEKESVIGATIKEIRRVGKGLIIDLDNSYSIAIHIKLTGQLIYRGRETETVEVSKTKVGEVPSQFTHVIFKLDKNAFLYYNDIRRFGWIKVVKTEEVGSLPFFKEMGPEPFKDLTLEKFKSVIEKGNSPVKIVIMDQKRIGGIGNIYANDALYLAKIDPRKKAKELSSDETKKLYDGILEVLQKGLRLGGASELTYVNALGQEGSYQEHFLVYGRQGKKCPNCGGIIKKIYLGGRGTYFCEQCQK